MKIKNESEVDIDYIRKNIKLIRESKNFAQREVAQALNVTTNSYQKMESGEIVLNMIRLHQIAEVFGMSVIDIINYPNSQNNESVKEAIEHLQNFIREKEKEIIEIKRLYIYERMRANRIMVNQSQDDLITAQNENLELETIQDLKDKIVFYTNEVEKDEKDLRDLGKKSSMKFIMPDIEQIRKLNKLYYGDNENEETK